jgi:lysine-N-methylase
MSFPLKHLPVLQNWDCQATGSCCKEYRIRLTEEERQRIEEQGWTPEELGGQAPVVRRGAPWNRHWELNHRPTDHGCVFLSEQGRCRIHERFGYEAKPLPCRLFPFVLVPAGDHWRVGLRFACPSAAASKGRALPEHDKELAVFAEQLARRENLQPRPDGSLTAPPRLDGRLRLDWPDTLRIVDALVQLLRNRRDPVERRLRKCLTFVGQMRTARLERVRGKALGELIQILHGVADAETPANPMMVPAPGWVGRLLFRQAAALYTRKDFGPNRGLAARGRLALMRAAWTFARGRGPVPRMHRGLPETTFEQAEVPRGPLPQPAEEVLERYYTLKVGSLQFCAFGIPLWEAFESLAVTLPVVLWVARLFRDVPREQAVTTALTVVDDHVGFNRVLASVRQRLSFRILARSGELARLIAWYSR